MFQPSFQEFARLSRQGNLVPVYQELLMDLETPLSFFKRLKRDRYSFLLESVEGSEHWARHSFLGTNPYLVFKARGNQVEIIENGKRKTFMADSPLQVLEELLGRYRPVPVEGMPPFFGGALGYVSYDAVEQLHAISNVKKDHLEIPAIYFIFVQTLVAFDNLKHTIKVIDNVRLDGKGSLREAYRESTARIQRLVSSLQKKTGRLEARDIEEGSEIKKPIPNVTPATFRKMVQKAKDYIRAGDIIQVVLSQRLETETRADPFEVYRALRFVNPSPYMFYLELDKLRIIGSSPETMVRLNEDSIELRPIAGTRPRGKSPSEEKELEADLLSDPKERAEHIMLVDLGRNDVGRVAEVGSVHVNELMIIERYSHVIHLASNIRGKMLAGKRSSDLFVSCFPAGTVSGAPKIRAMQIISELEPEKRGLYAGAIGYFGFNGNMDTCIVIRTILMHGRKVCIHAGAGIVADSDPHKEYQETLNKAGAMLKAVNLAEMWSRGAGRK
jgi:anthranilate synthase component 1